jgi:hypothetical protein
MFHVGTNRRRSRETARAFGRGFAAPVLKSGFEEWKSG